MSEWKPGDVAMRGTQRLFYTGNGRFVNRYGTVQGEYGGTRPLVVIDYEDVEQVERFREIASRWADAVPYDEGPGDLNHTTAMQAALREFARPTRIEEPQGPLTDDEVSTLRRLLAERES